MQQERTKTQNCAKITSTANEDTCEYGGYVYTMIIIIGLLWAREKTQHEKQTEVRLAKRLGLIQRLRFSNLGLSYRDEHSAGQGVAQHFQVGLPSRHSSGMPGVGNDV